MTDSASPAVQLTGCTRRFDTPAGGEYVAVRDVDLTVECGRFVSIVGPTGCGKSTLLNLAAGLLQPSAGEVFSFGRPLSGLNRRASYMFQQDALLPWKTVLDNVTLGLRMRGVAAKEANEKAAQWLRRVGLERFANRYPYQLSGGMRKRTAIAQTWIVDPDVLLMDEPFSALDIQTRQLMENELLQLWQGSNKAVLFVTHDLDEAIALSDEVVLLGAGPGSRVAGRYEIDLDRPRDLLDIRSRPEFTRIHQEIWSQLRDEVMKTYAKDVPALAI
jgi:NitT/TauT family transport system ATP-binding protein